MALRRQKHTLANDDIDKISAAALGELEAYRITEENLIKTRFSLEEALLRMQEHFGQEAEIELSIGRRAGRQIIEVKALRVTTFRRKAPAFADPRRSMPPQSMATCS